MKKFVRKKDKYTNEFVECKKGKEIIKYFYLICDICGAKHPDVCVNELCEEEGFPEGDYCWNCQMSMREQGFVGKDKSVYFRKKDYPKSNKEKLDRFLKWAKNFCKKNKLSLIEKGFWTYDNDFFSWDYLSNLIKGRYIIINKNMGKKPKPETINAEGLGDTARDKEIEKLVKKIAAENEVQPWYYKSMGKIFETDVLKEKFGVKNEKIILNKFSKTKNILKCRRKNYSIHADWWGMYFLVLAILAGKSFHEKIFETNELYKLRGLIEKEKPKGVVLSYVISDKDCPIYDIDLMPIVNLFDIPELKYFKLLFVSKTKVMKTPTKKPWPEDAIGLGLDSKYIAVPHYDGKVEWVLAYSR